MTAKWQSEAKNLVFAIPSYNDWEALEKLLLLIDEVAFPEATRVEIFVIDDYSSNLPPASLVKQKYNQIVTVSILRLRRNLGHQKAIAVGLCYIHQNLDCDLVVVMDGDGEDNPFEVTRLLDLSAKTGSDKIIFAKRSKRTENLRFKALYFIYKKLYNMLTGRTISVGNFSLVPAKVLKNLVVISEIWIHYSSGIHRSKIPYLEINVPRSVRLDGQPKMNLVSLVTHGLSSIAVYGDVVGTRMLLAISVALVLLLFLSGIVVAIKLFTTLAIPGWATYMIAFLLILALQLVLTGTVFSLIILTSRNVFSVVPIRDYKYYVDDVLRLNP
jgi:glycosyltransferase involved in cell wall biosynthesis